MQIGFTQSSETECNEAVTCNFTPFAPPPEAPRPYTAARRASLCTALNILLPRTMMRLSSLSRSGEILHHRTSTAALAMPSLPRPVVAALLALAVRIASAVSGGRRADSTPQDQASVEIASFEHGVAVWDPHVLNDRRRKLHPGIPCSSSAQPPEHCPGGVLCPPSGHCPAQPSGQNSRLDVKH